MLYEIQVVNAEGVQIGVLEPISISFTSKFMQAGSASFDVQRQILDIDSGEEKLNPNLTAEITETWNRVYVYYNGEDETELVWEGWTTSSVNLGLSQRFTCTDFWGWIEKKKIELGREYIDQPINDILNTEWGFIEAIKTSLYTISSTLTELITTKVEDGQSFTQLLREIIGLGHEVDPTFPLIKVEVEVGRDLTGPTGEKLFYSFDETASSNIAFPKDFEFDGARKINRLIAIGDADRVVVGSPLAGEELLIGTKNFEKYEGTDLALLANAYLDSVRNDILDFSVVPVPGAFSPGQLKVGDKIPVEILNEDDIFDVNDVYRIVEIGINNVDAITNIVLSKTDPFSLPLEDILDRLKRLEQSVY